MGYTTEFSGRFRFDKKLDDETHELLVGLASTRRVKRQGLDSKYGIDGEFYFDPEDLDNFGQTRDSSIVDYNNPPSSQPSLWLQWIPSEDGLYLEWDGNEKFYDYIEWLQYLVDKIIVPRGYTLNGTVTWQGEDFLDRGTISVSNNKISTDSVEGEINGLKAELKQTHDALYSLIRDSIDQGQAAHLLTADNSLVRAIAQDTLKTWSKK